MESLPKIIVLDDETELRNMLQRFLSGHGFEVRVGDGHAGDQVLIGHRPKAADCPQVIGRFNRQ